MHKKAAILITVVALATLAFASLAVAGKPGQGKVPNGPAGRSSTSHLYLYEKDPDTWEIVPDGASGKMKYSHEAADFSFVFNGHGLEAGMDYTLIYYPDPWPGSGLICLGSGTANGGGNVHIMNTLNTGDLPIMNDANYPDGAKIWLVLTSDVDCATQQMTAWNPVEYLFEYDLITFDDTDF